MTRPKRYGAPLFEVHVVPASRMRLESRHLVGLSDELASLGRQRGLSSAAAALSSQSGDGVVVVESEASYGGSENGIMVTRAGPARDWILLPSDTIGSVLVDLELALTESVGFAVGVNPVGMLTGRRRGGLSADDRAPRYR